MSDNTNNNNNEDKLEIDLSTESLQIDLNDLKTDIELNFDNLENTVDVTPIDDNQPIENISLMSNNAPTVEEPISQELSLSEPSLSFDLVTSNLIGYLIKSEYFLISDFILYSFKYSSKFSSSVFSLRCNIISVPYESLVASSIVYPSTPSDSHS